MLRNPLILFLAAVVGCASPEPASRSATPAKPPGLVVAILVDGLGQY